MATKKIKVSQSTIDDIKRLGMTKSLELAGKNAGATQAGVTAEWREGVRRMYGDRRLALAEKGSPTAPLNYTSKSANQPAPKTAAYAQGKKGMTNSKSDYPATKKSGFHLTGKEVAGGAAALALLIATKGRSASMMTKGAAAAGKASAKAGVVAGKASSKVTGAVLKGKDLADLKAGQAAAKAGKMVTEAQWEAMKANAKARGINVRPNVKVKPKASQSVASVSGLTGLAGQLAERGTAALAKKKAAEAAAKAAAAKAAKAAAAKKAAAAAAKKPAPKLPPKVSTKKLAIAGTSATTITVPKKKK